MTRRQIYFYVLAILVITILAYFYTSLVQAPEILDEVGSIQDIEQN